MREAGEECASGVPIIASFLRCSTALENSRSIYCHSNKMIAGATGSVLLAYTLLLYCHTSNAWHTTESRSAEDSQGMFSSHPRNIFHHLHTLHQFVEPLRLFTESKRSEFSEQEARVPSAKAYTPSSTMSIFGF